MAGGGGGGGGGGWLPAPSLAYASGAHLRDLAPEEQKNVAAMASRWRYCGDRIKPQTFRTDSLCAWPLS